MRVYQYQHSENMLFDMSFQIIRENLITENYNGRLLLDPIVLGDYAYTFILEATI